MRIPLLLLAVFFPAQLHANDIYFPQVVFGGGYTTTFTILNSGSIPVTSTVRFYDPNGNARTAFNTPVSIMPGGSTRFSLPNSGPLTVLSGELAAAGTTVQAAVTFESFTDSGTVLTSATVSAVDAGTSFRVPVDVTSGIAISNPGAASVGLTLRLLREDGSVMATASDVRLQALGTKRQYTGFVSSFFPQLEGTLFKGTLIIESASPIAATAVAVRENTLTALPVITGAASGGTLYFPQVVFGGGYSTSFVLMNTGTTSVASRVEFYDQSGNSRGEFMTPVNIPAGGSTRFSFPDSGALTVLWAEVAATSLKGAATFEQRGRDGTLITTGAVIGVHGSSSLRLPVDMIGANSTALAIANVSRDTAIRVNARLVNEGGTPILEAIDVRLAPLGARRQIATYVRALFPLISATFSGTLVIEPASGSPANALVATGLTLRERGSAIDGPPAIVRTLPRELSSAERRIAEGTTAFSFALWNQMTARERGKNVFVSPLSAAFALGMTMNGAAGSTWDEMRSALQFGGATEQEINEGFRSMIALLGTLDPSVKMEVANSIWYRQTVPFYDTFKDAAAQYFDAEVRGLDFDNQKESLAAINGWVDAKTRHKIPTILDEIDPRHMMYLINAIYFNGTWREKFDALQTISARFTREDGSTQTASLMHRHAQITYADAATYQAADLPYGNSAFSMTVLLPRAGNSVDSIAASLTPTSWKTLADRLTTTSDVDLYLPKFKLDSEFSLVRDLNALGMTTAFEDSANFSRLSPMPMKISEVKQKTFVDVHEEGTEAAAVTVVVAVPTSAPPPPILMRVDRPFIFVIRERLSGTVLFMGRIVTIP